MDSESLLESQLLEARSEILKLRQQLDSALSGNPQARAQAQEDVQHQQQSHSAASTTKMGPSRTIRSLYNAFNDRDAQAAADLLTDDCVYEDLLLGASTVCRGKKAFATALQFHPAFVASSMTETLPPEIKKWLPDLRLIVDATVEGPDAVGVEWHVELGNGVPFPLGRGLSHATVDPQSGRISRVVDIAEAPWRVVGILIAPVLSILVYFGEVFLMTGG